MGINAILGMVLATVIFGSPVAGGASSTGKYALKGLGGDLCSDFLSARQSGSEKYRRYGAWLAGYLSGVNRFNQETVDVAPWQDMDVFAAYVSNACDRDGKARFVDAIDRVISVLWTERIKHDVEQIPIQVGDWKGSLYENTIARIEVELKERGFLASDPNRTFDQRTISALKQFQEYSNIPVSGAPTQRTLYLIFK